MADLKPAVGSGREIPSDFFQSFESTLKKSLKAWHV